MQVDDRVDAVFRALAIRTQQYEPYQFDDPVKVLVTSLFNHTRVHVIFEVSIVDLDIRFTWRIPTHGQPYRVESKRRKELGIFLGKPVFQELVKEVIALLCTQHISQTLSKLVFMSGIPIDEILHGHWM